MRSFLRPALAGAAATCSGNGLARFAYVPLFPAMVAAGWVDGGGAGMLGAAALAGYLVGVLGGGWLARGAGVPRALDGGMALVALSLAACAWNGGFAWLMGWRFAAGVAGGAADGAGRAGGAGERSARAARRGGRRGDRRCRQRHRGRGAPGAGAAAGGAARDLDRPRRVGAAALGVRASALAEPARRRRAAPPPRRRPLRRARRPWCSPTGCTARGWCRRWSTWPTWRRAGAASESRGARWRGCSSAWAARRAACCRAGSWTASGASKPCALWLGVQVAALALSLPPFAVLVPAASLSAGFAAIGVTAVTLTVTREMAPERPAALWVRCTASFAVAQAAVGFALAALFAATGESHAAVFGAGLAFSAAALATAFALRSARAPVRA